MNNAAAAPLVELFSSIQGEGMLVGARQIFLRLWGCNISCAYCDTRQDAVPENCQLETTPGRRDFVAVPNPVSFERVKGLLERWSRGWPGIHHSLSLTGGEPLLHPQFLRSVLPEIACLFPVYLETNGLLPDALEQVLDRISMIGMDIKLPSATGCQIPWDVHRSFLQVCGRKDVFVKLVVTDTTEEWELRKACGIVAAVRRDIPCILQPMTGSDGNVAVSAAKILELQEISSQILPHVRVIPQTHKFMKQL